MPSMSAVWTYQRILQSTFVCVKCGGSHTTASCKEPNNTPATWALCDGLHPPNYKGCGYYHSLLKPYNTNNRLNTQRNHTVNMPTSNLPVRPEVPQPTINNTCRNVSHADVTRGVPHISQPEDDTSTIT
jgi:hypothetical protein